VTAESVLASTGSMPTAGRTASPLAGYADRFTGLDTATRGQVRLAEVPLLAQVVLRADPTTDLNAVTGGPLPAPGRAAGDWPRVLGLGPDEWLILSTPGTQQELLGKLRASLDGDGAVTDVSGQRTTIALAGPRSQELLAKGCALDLHPRAFGRGRCAQTLLGNAQVVLVAAPNAEHDYWILPRSSFARYVADWLLDAAVEYAGSGHPGAALVTGP
jgi:sarcosine oxidase, subunit gamma